MPSAIERSAGNTTGHGKPRSLMGAEWLIPLLFALVAMFLLSGHPVAFALAGASLLCALMGAAFGLFDLALLRAIPSRAFGIAQNPILLTIPMFVLMGNILERSQVANDLLAALSQLLRSWRGGLGCAVVLVGVLMGASTGIVGATVVTLAIFALPTLRREGYPDSFSSGLITATGTLGQLVPPSIILILLGDTLSSSWQETQLRMGNFAPSVISVGDLFAAALLPALALAGLYLAYVLISSRRPGFGAASALKEGEGAPAATGMSGPRMWLAIVFPTALIVAVLGSIIAGIAAPSEASAVGVLAALAIAKAKGMLKIDMLREALHSTLLVSAMIFMILIGASIFSLVFRGLGGDEMVHQIAALVGEHGINRWVAFMLVMLLIFVLGFVLDFIEIIYIVVPIVVPLLAVLGFDPLWLGIMIGINLQTSFLTPPFGFSLFYYRSIAPPSISTWQIYRGAVPFIGIQLLCLALVAFFPELATWLPEAIYG